MSKFDIYVKVTILINYNSTTTIIPCMTHLPDLLTNGRYIDPVTLTYILRSIDFDTIYVDIPDLLNNKAYNYQTLHSASPRCTDSAGSLTRWPWPIFSAPVTLTHFVSTFDISSTIRLHPSNRQSVSSQCTDSADTLTWWPWPIFWLQWLWHNLLHSRLPQV